MESKRLKKKPIFFFGWKGLYALHFFVIRSHLLPLLRILTKSAYANKEVGHRPVETATFAASVYVFFLLLLLRRWLHNLGGSITEKLFALHQGWCVRPVPALAFKLALLLRSVASRNGGRRLKKVVYVPFSSP